ncbi:DUF4089 domain-containing protein [Leptolyngbya sp. PCC 6406]|uniref:DUF4089 domain-containing protein n=1 Tax=Leptolyngbya sp. PCC 6406 TaxID=1173264 RepID=UPI0002ACCE7D|nr:DUF4089 domain-containing protein [Leptolyngbya sp. PCC 6406]
MSPWQAYVETTAALLHLEIPAVILPSVVENFDRIVAIAQPVLDFPLGETDEPAPIFDPEGSAHDGTL